MEFSKTIVTVLYSAEGDHASQSPFVNIVKMKRPVFSDKTQESSQNLFGQFCRGAFSAEQFRIISFRFLHQTARSF